MARSLLEHAYEQLARFAKETTMLMLLLLLFLVLAIGGGSWGHSRYGYVGWSPVGIILVIAVVLFFTGNLHFR